ncbi:MAG: T9SS type A sorting domain-containing protein [Chitinophagales bacterium]
MKLTLKFLSFSIAFLVLSNSYAQSQDVRMFIFGHSLLVHEFTDNPPPSDELTVPHWMYLLAEEAGQEFAVSGQYGFLPQHANLPPFAQWGFDIVPPVWDSDVEAFSEANFSHAMITAGNFMQYQAPDEPYFGEDGVISPVLATVEIADWLVEQEEGMKVYIYENWPDMAGFIAGEGFPPSEGEFANYNGYTTGEFHDWWIDYQDALLELRPDYQTRMIPVGPIISGLLTETALSGIPILSLYEDNAPHGRPTTYFLAALVTYMGVYGEMAPLGFDVPNLVHPLVKENYVTVVNYIWNELQQFNDGEGNSRVFFEGMPTSIENESPFEANIRIFPNPTQDLIRIEAMGAEAFEFQLLNGLGEALQSGRIEQDFFQLDLGKLTQGLYLLKVGSRAYRIVKN